MRIVYGLGAALIVGVAILTAVLAFATVQGGEPAGIDALTARMIRSDARHASDFPPLALDIETARLDVGAGHVVSATVRWRTIFNVPFGVTHIDGRSQSNSFSFGRLLGTWAAFAAGELLLLAAAVWMWLRAADER
jgi:hypothetical protein